VQVTLSENTVEIARKVFEFVVWPAALKLSHYGYLKLRQAQTDNSNRNRDETVKLLSIYLDKKFTEHEGSAFKRLDTQDSKVEELSVRLDEVEKVLNEINKKLKV
jgi:hypothetical protein